MKKKKANGYIKILHFTHLWFNNKPAFSYHLLPLPLIPSLPPPPFLPSISLLSLFYFDPVTFFKTRKFPSNSLLFLLPAFLSPPDTWLACLPCTKTKRYDLTSVQCSRETQRDRAAKDEITGGRNIEELALKKDKWRWDEGIK